MREGFSGSLQTDGYSGYNAVEGVTRVGCRAHDRRKRADGFPHGVPAESSISKQAFALVEKLFCGEKKLKQQNPPDWKQHRKEHLEHFGPLLHLPQELPKLGE